MKIKFLAIILVLSMLLGVALTACGGSGESGSTADTNDTENNLTTSVGDNTSPTDSDKDNSESDADSSVDSSAGSSDENTEDGETDSSIENSDESSADVSDETESEDSGSVTDTETEVETESETEPKQPANIYDVRDELLIVEDNDFLSRTSNSYENINGKTVTVYTFFRNIDEAYYNNPNFAQFVMVQQAMRYKDKHPNENVRIAIASYHLSVYLGACLDPESSEYGKLINLYDKEYTDGGFYRLSYLLVEAAKKGIDVTVLGHVDAASTINADGVRQEDKSFKKFFTSHLSDAAYIDGKTVGDFMTFSAYDWTAVGDKGAADMMHNKVCVVSHYTDNDGNDHENAFWTGSINIDGVSAAGQNGNNSIQTALVVANHAEMCRVAFNYLKLLANYPEQSDPVRFREKVIRLTTEQVELINSGRANEITADEQIIYLGTENDKVFELYFTPFGGVLNSWDTTYNPYSKYLSKLLPAVSGGDYIEIIWNNVKFINSFEFAGTISRILEKAFTENKNSENILHLHLPGLDSTPFDDLKVGRDLAYNWVNGYRIGYHTKDLQLSYKENGERYYVTVYNSLNFHEGSMYHQTNTVLVIKESTKTGNTLYCDYGILTVPGMDLESRRVSAR